MKNSKTKHPKWATIHRTSGTELRLIKGRYYLYGYKTVYDQVKKKPKKISLGILGSITEKEGFKHSLKKMSKANPSLVLNHPILIREYGISKLVVDKFAPYCKLLKKYFADQWKEILAIAYCRFLYRCPLKSVVYKTDSSYLPQLLELTEYNEKTASAILNRVGKNQQSRHNYMRSFIKSEDYILMDGTNILSKSKHIDAVRAGYNNQKDFEGQINLMYIYSSSQRMPVYYRVLPGNIREVKAFRNTLQIAGIKKAIVIADKGFYSEKNIHLLQEEKLSFIIPLKRDSSLIDYSLIKDNTFKNKATFFMHQKRPVWGLLFNLNGYSVHLFLDDSLKLKEETDYLTRIKNNPDDYDLVKYEEKRNRFGTIAMITDSKFQDSCDVYETYKSRMYIEVMFDGMKNIMEADHTYMQDPDTLEGWMFINHICLQWYQELYIELKDKGILKKISVNDYIQLMTDIKQVKINNTWQLNEFTNATQNLLSKIGVKI